MRQGIILLAAWAALAASAAAASSEPPMGQFDGAFYGCDQGQAFQVSYDSSKAKKATLTTSNNNKQYHLKRVDSAAGPQFTDGTVKASFSGDQAAVQGTAIKLTGCKLKTTT